MLQYHIEGLPQLVKKMCPALDPNLIDNVTVKAGSEGVEFRFDAGNKTYKLVICHAGYDRDEVALYESADVPSYVSIPLVSDDVSINPVDELVLQIEVTNAPQPSFRHHYGRSECYGTIAIPEEHLFVLVNKATFSSEEMEAIMQGEEDEEGGEELW